MRGAGLEAETGRSDNQAVGWRQWGVLFVFAALAFSMGPLIDYTPLGHLISLKSLYAFRTRWGDVPLAWLLYVLGAGLAATAGFPFILLTIAAGVIFGAWMGITLALLAGLLSGVLGYYIGRLVGQEVLNRFMRRRYESVKQWLANHALVAVLSMRVIIPFAAANLISGALRLSMTWYLVGTFLGLLPWVLFIASTASHAVSPEGIGWRVSLIGLGLFAAVMFGHYLQQKLMQRIKKPSRPG